MADVHFFTFNDFQENTYILSDETKECVIIDPGCNTKEEQKILQSYIEENSLKPVRLLNTHCHIDHVLGNKFVADTYGLELEIHRGEVPVLDSCIPVAGMYGIHYDVSPAPGKFIEEGDTIHFGNTEMKVLLTPGHSPASLCFLNESEKWCIAGDALFYESIGRTDLPGGDYDTLILSIMDNLLVLDDEVRIYPGHGPSTTIGHERVHNPFL